MIVVSSRNSHHLLNLLGITLFYKDVILIIGITRLVCYHVLMYYASLFR